MLCLNLKGFLFFLRHDLGNGNIFLFLMSVLHIVKVYILDHASKVFHLWDSAQVLWLLFIDAVLGSEGKACIDWIGLLDA